MARGQYVVFVDGDDSIAEGSLQRIHDRIAANPGADLYPCAIVVNNEMTHLPEPVRDNYPADLYHEMTGPEATRISFLYHRDPCPMLQLTVCRRDYLVENDLWCGEGLRCEDSEFSPRALYLAKRVVPLHVPYYNYRIRAHSIITSAKQPGYFYNDHARILKSNLAFFAKISREPGYDKRISPLWAAKWLNWMYLFWFSPKAIRGVGRERRRDTLAAVFVDGFDNLDLLTRAASLPRKVSAVFRKLFIRHPALGWLADAYFLYAYNSLADFRDKLKGGR